MKRDREGERRRKDEQQAEAHSRMGNRKQDMGVRQMSMFIADASFTNSPEQATFEVPGTQALSDTWSLSRNSM